MNRVTLTQDDINRIPNFNPSIPFYWDGQVFQLNERKQILIDDEIIIENFSPSDDLQMSILQAIEDWICDNYEDYAKRGAK